MEAEVLASSSSAICDEVLVSLRRIMRAIDLHSKHLVEEYGLTGPQLIVLKELTGHRELSVGKLAKAVSLSQATVTGILGRLKKRRLVETHPDQADRRRVLVQATKLGKDTLRGAPSLLQDHFVAELEKLEEWEQTLILSSLQRVVSMMEAEKLEAVPVLITGAVTSTTAEVSSSATDVATDMGTLPIEDSKDPKQASKPDNS
jgi:DNA-binding MarR family transcriptional regulator